MRRVVSLLFAALLTFAFFLPALSITNAQASSAYDLIAAVNSLRAARGLLPFNINGALMASAQSHSDFQASIKSITHTGAGGTRPVDRAYAAGYGGGKTVFISENIAGGSIASLSLDLVINSYWQDDLHMYTMLNSSETDVGAGMTVADGWVYYTLDAGWVAGSPANNTPVSLITSTPGTPGAPLPTGFVTEFAPPVIPNTPQTVKPVLTATANPDGSVVHVVEPGQAPWSIAIAYGVKVVDLIKNNRLAPTPVLYIGQKLVVVPAFTATPTPGPTSTPLPPTRTATRTRSPRTATPLRTITPFPTSTPRLIFEGVPGLRNVNTRSLGIGLVAVCVLGLAAILYGAWRGRSRS